MDNLTHTLISAMVGEVIHRSTPPSQTLTESARRNVAIAVMVIGGNLPDSDVIYTAWAGAKLDYLLHHRGHTHTIVGSTAVSVGGLIALAAAVVTWANERRG
jgi:inner membrane protein